MTENPEEATRLLRRMRAGEPAAAEELLSLVEEELRRLAHGQMRHQPAGHTLQTTALVNEAWIRLAGSEGRDFESRQHFLAVAARAMRSVLVDDARRRLAQKRRGGARVSFAEDLAVDQDEPGLHLRLHEALEGLRALDPRLEQVAELRIFGGRSCAEIAEVSGIALRTVERSWRTAKSWLQRELGAGGSAAGDGR